jgi:Flp pilus assembly protein TadG
MTRPRHVLLAASADDGMATPVETMYLLVFCLSAVVLLGYLGRLHATGVQVTNAAQAAARVASQAPTPGAARTAATASVQHSALRARCDGGLRVVTTWVPSSTRSWQGGSVTVSVSCTVRNRALAGVWSPGSRVVTMRDTQPVDRYRR